MLALSNDPQQIVELVLDKLHQLLEVDSCWVQLLDAERRDLRLVAHRGFTSDMKRADALVDSGQSLSGRVAMGLKVVIADLSRDGRYGLSAFGKAGLRSLVAVPIRTYRPHGVLGVASRSRKSLDDETADLLMTIAGLVGAAINSAELGRLARSTRDEEAAAAQAAETTGVSDGPRGAEGAVRFTGPPAPGEAASHLPAPVPADEAAGAERRTFGRHASRMATFRRVHDRR